MRDDGVLRQQRWECRPSSSSSSSADNMTLPVSSYEELLARVRNLTNETIQLRQLTATPLLVVDHNDNERFLNSSGTSTYDNNRTQDASKRGTGFSTSSWNTREQFQDSLGGIASVSHPHSLAATGTGTCQQNNGKRDSARLRDVSTTVENCSDDLMTASLVDHIRSNARIGNKEYVMDEPKEEDEKIAVEGVRMTSSATQTRHGSEPGLASLYHGSWPGENATLWHSGPSSIGRQEQDTASVTSFSSSSEGRRSFSNQQLGAKVEMVYNLLSMLGTHDKEDMAKTLLAMSSSSDSCLAMRQSGCLPLLVQLLHSPERDPETRRRASRALHNIVHAHPDEKKGRREARVLRLLEQIREYCDESRLPSDATSPGSDDTERHPGPTIAALMKLSFDEEHRHAMCQLGALHAIAELLEVDHEAHGSTTVNQYCIALRRYAGMALTNLTFGDGANKALLCSLHPFMSALVAQLDSPSEDLRQVTASVLRNLSWQADASSKQRLREVGAVTALMRAAMEAKKESTLKSILSALWNLSAHCTLNKVDICAVEGAVEFLVEMLNYKAPSKTMAIVENAGGILRNVSSHIAVREDLRMILREHNCLPVLLAQLKSPSLTVVSNACGTLWNLSARCPTDQQMLWNLGAVGMLRSLVHSKHRMISMGSSAALKNLLAARPNCPLPSTTPGAHPGLAVRKRRALEQELDQSLAETCDNIEPASSPPRRSDSRDSVTSTLSDSMYERVARTYGMMQKSSPGTLTGSLSDSERMHPQITPSSERRFLRRYYNSLKEKDEERSLLNLERSNEDNTLERGSKATDSYQQCSRLSQIEESDKGPFLRSNSYTVTRPTYQSHGDCELSAAQTCYEDSTCQREPVDYSLRYIEPVIETQNSSHDREINSENGPLQNDLGRGYVSSGSKIPSATASKNVKTNVHHRSYTEAELDQPKDYSLLCVEDEEESDLEMNEDVRLGVHSATRRSDEATYHANDEPRCEETVVQIYEEGQPVPDESGIDHVTSVKRESHSERASHYFEEDENTCPGQFAERSRSSESDQEKMDLQENLVTTDHKPYKAGKVVAFGRVSAEDTPLMFSRRSSLGSVDSADTHHNIDQGSVVSDFSNHVSGIVSPSELPDSPTQSRPSSPCHVKMSVDVTREETGIRPSGIPRNVFDDGVTWYREEDTPVEFSRETSLSSLTVADDEPKDFPSINERDDGMEKQDTEKEKKEKEIGELPPLSEVDEAEDEEIVAACIARGMRSGSRRRLLPPTPVSTPPRTSGIPIRSGIPSRLPRAVRAANIDTCVYSQGAFDDSVHTYHTEDTPPPLGCHTAEALTDGEEEEPRLSNVHHEHPSNHGSNISSDGENLTECVRSGMPKPRTRPAVKPSSPCRRPPSRRPPSHHLCGLDHGPRKSPVRIMKSSTVGAGCTPAGDEIRTYATEDSPRVFSNRSSVSDLTQISDMNTDTNNDICDSEKPPLEPHLLVRVTSEENTSLESVSQDTTGESSRTTTDNMIMSSDGSWCVQNKTSSTSEDPVTVLSRNASLSSLSVDSFGSAELTPSEQLLIEQCISSGMPKGKSSLLLKKSERFKACSRDGSYHGASKSATDTLLASQTVRDEDMVVFDDFEMANTIDHANFQNMIDVQPSDEEKEEISPVLSDEKSPVSLGESPSDNVDKGSDAMLTSFEKMTEEASKKSSDPNIMKQSDTWNEDSSPNDISFPTMSVSAPTVGSFKSDIRDDLLPELVEEDMASRGSISLTDSHILETEANKVVGAVQEEPCSLDHSVNSLDLDAIKPPSMMGSLVSLTSLSGQQENGEVLSAPAHLSRNGSRSSRKKSLPPGMMVRRALGVNTSVENLLDNISVSSSYNSQLDNMKPPSAMDEVMDLENSMVSVASITSEVADSSNKEQSHSEQSAGNSDAAFDLMKPAANAMAQVYIAQHGGSDSVTDCLDNIDPPSAFDDVTEAAAIGSEMIGSDTEPCVDETRVDVDTPDLPSDAKSTPVPSSAESTPKKSPFRSRLTPKQKRQVSKQRYMTYTIDSELPDDETVGEVHLNKEGSEGSVNQGTFKITPKQRRLEDRKRFETQVLEKQLVNDIKAESPVPFADKGHDSDETPDQDEDMSPSQSPRRKTIKQKRKEAKERFVTRTLSEEEKGSGLVPLSSDKHSSYSLEMMENLLEHEAKIVINTLNATRCLSSESSDPRCDIALLDCETLSLVSIDSESEHEYDVDLPCYFEVNGDKVDDSHSEESDDDEYKVENKATGPRIVKPSDPVTEEVTNLKTDDEIIQEQDVPKPIRGRRKPLYSSSTKSNYSTQKFGSGRGGIPILTAARRPSSSSPISRKPLAKTYSASATPRNTSPKFQQGNLKFKSSFTKTKPNISKVSSKGKENSMNTKNPSQRNASNVDARYRPPERQGTFTKDEPTTPNIMKAFPSIPNSPTKGTRIPVPSSLLSDKAADIKKKKNSVIPKVASLSADKPKLRREMSQPSPSVYNRANKARSQDCTTAIKSLEKSTNRNTYTRSAPHTKLANRRSVCVSEMKTSLSNQSLQSNDSARGGSPKHPATTNGLSQRSTSNCSLNSVSSVGKRSAKKEVVSKIAGIWKRTETKSKSGTATPKENSTKSKLVRSSTFEGVDRKITDVSACGGKDFENSPKKRVAEVHPSTRGSQQQEVVMRRPRSEGDDKTKRLSRLGSFIRIESDEPDNKKVPPASAVVQPFNYSPPPPIGRDSGDVFHPDDLQKPM